MRAPAWILRRRVRRLHRAYLRVETLEQLLRGTPAHVEAVRRRRAFVQSSVAWLDHVYQEAGMRRQRRKAEKRRLIGTRGRS